MSLEVPLTRQLKYHVVPGSLVQVSGHVPKGSQGFSVNLVDANMFRVLHVNPRFSEKTVVLNSTVNGQWGQEERTSGFPLHHEKAFDLLLIVTVEHFAVILNGELIAEYKHRVTTNAVKYVNVDGDVQVTGVYEATNVHLKKKGYKMVFRTNPIEWQGPSRTAHIHGGLKVGEDILISCKPVTGDQFVVNLRAGNDIAFQLNPRYAQGVVVRNACVGGAWGETEVAGAQPFHQGKDVNIQINVKQDRLVVYVNGAKYYTFKHRFTKLDQIDTIDVANLDIYQIQVV